MRIALRPATRADLSTLIDWATSPEFLMQWTGWRFTYPLDAAQVDELYRQAEGVEPSLLPFMVVRADTGETAGYVDLRLDRDNGTGNVGAVILAEPYRGRGLGRQLMDAVVREGFEELGLRRLTLVVFDFNDAALRCYHRAGFRIEGHLREARRCGEEFWGLYTMALLERDWRASADGAARPDRQRVSTGTPWEPIVGYSRAVRVRNQITVAGTTATGPGGHLVGAGDAYLQTVQALRNVVAALEQLGASAADVVRTRIFVTDIERWQEVGRAHGEVFGDVRPAATMVEVRRLVDPEMLVEIEADAILSDTPTAS